VYSRPEEVEVEIEVEIGSLGVVLSSRNILRLIVWRCGV